MYWNITAANRWTGTIAININMRCIEIDGAVTNEKVQSWLTLTWDVLKWYLQAAQ